MIIDAHTCTLTVLQNSMIQFKASLISVCLSSIANKCLLENIKLYRDMQKHIKMLATVVNDKDY